MIIDRDLYIFSPHDDESSPKSLYAKYYIESKKKLNCEENFQILELKGFFPILSMEMIILFLCMLYIGPRFPLASVMTISVL